LIGERLDGQEVDDTQRSDCSCSSAPADVRAGFALRGHQIKLLEPFSFTVGQGAAVVRDSSRQVNFAAGDPRSDGAAIPQEPPAQ